MPETWWEYVMRISGSAANKEVGAAAGVDPSQVSRWSRDGNPDAKHVVAFARTYKRPPVEALIAAGYLQPDDIVEGAVQVYQSLSGLSDDALLAEIARRFND